MASYAIERWGRQRIVTYSGGDRKQLVSPAGTFDSLHDATLAVMNFPYYGGAYNSQSATTTSQTLKFVHLRPHYELDVTKALSVSGTAIATITKSSVGLYSSDGTTLTKLAENSTNTTSGLWDTANTFYAQAIASTPIRLDPNVSYYVAMLVNATTPGTHGGFVKVTNQPDFSNTYGKVPMYTLASQTSLPSSQAISGLTAAYNLVPWVGLA